MQHPLWSVAARPGRARPRAGAWPGARERTNAIQDTPAVSMGWVQELALLWRLGVPSCIANVAMGTQVRYFVPYMREYCTLAARRTCLMYTVHPART